MECKYSEGKISTDFHPKQHTIFNNTFENINNTCLLVIIFCPVYYLVNKMKVFTKKMNERKVSRL